MRHINIKKAFTLIFISLFILILSTTSYAAEQISIRSGAGLLVERSQDRVLFEKNAYKKMYP